VEQVNHLLSGLTIYGGVNNISGKQVQTDKIFEGKKLSTIFSQQKKRVFSSSGFPALFLLFFFFFEESLFSSKGRSKLKSFVSKSRQKKNFSLGKTLAK